MLNTRVKIVGFIVTYVVLVAYILYLNTPNISSELSKSFGKLFGGGKTETAVVPDAPKKQAEPEAIKISADVSREIYVVKEGDTLSIISKKAGMSWQEIYALNQYNIKNPDLIFPGQTIDISRKDKKNPIVLTTMDLHEGEKKTEIIKGEANIIKPIEEQEAPSAPVQLVEEIVIPDGEIKSELDPVAIIENFSVPGEVKFAWLEKVKERGFKEEVVNKNNFKEVSSKDIERNPFAEFQSEVYTIGYNGDWFDLIYLRDIDIWAWRMNPAGISHAEIAVIDEMGEDGEIVSLVTGLLSRHDLTISPELANFSPN